MPVSSAWISGEILPARDIDHAVEIFESAETKYRYSVAWFDSLVRGRIWAEVSSTLEISQRSTNWTNSDVSRLMTCPLQLAPNVPIDLPGFVLNPLTVRGFNSVIYSAPSARTAQPPGFLQFVFLSTGCDWRMDRIYGARGFVQYQCVWPLSESRSGMIEVLEAIAKSRRPSFLTVLKKFGQQKGGMLSFRCSDYTLALDFP